ncbi:stage III sporulation protein AE [Anaerosinus gibii]|uniref:Stage III sporulation protein AE n=1 Tax=Selenobaculum gibii TaxID=3054208 RepID=A0A9Y2EVU4_9FIRM|nr:stage III sporulation protein AE [Selenobaculum gbiensis]WIW71689.1 stage III sporulation protein AE [Selenobaculum gbiensis]
MKKFFTIILYFFLFTTNVYAEEVVNRDEIEAEVFSTLSTDAVNHFIDDINKDLTVTVPSLDIATIKKIAEKGLDLDFTGIGNDIMRKIFHEIVTNAEIMGKLLFLAVLCTLLRNLQNSFENSSIAMLAYSVCFVFLSVIALTAFYHALQIAAKTIDSMVTFMEAILPLMITLLAGVGALTSASLFSPLMVIVVGMISNLVKTVVFPLLMISAGLECTNYIADKYKLSNLTSLLKQSSMVCLGFMMVVFIGIITIQGVTGGVADGLTLRTAKFATASFIPVVGKVFADTVELAMGAALLIKNSIGIFGVIVIIMICLLPMIKMFSLVLIIKVTGALIQPMGDERMAKCLMSIGNHLLLAAGALLTVVLMFFLAITMIVGIGSMAVMLR